MCWREIYMAKGIGNFAAKVQTLKNERCGLGLFPGDCGLECGDQIMVKLIMALHDGASIRGWGNTRHNVVLRQIRQQTFHQFDQRNRGWDIAGFCHVFPVCCIITRWEKRTEFLPVIAGTQKPAIAIKPPNPFDGGNGTQKIGIAVVWVCCCGDGLGLLVGSFPEIVCLDILTRNPARDKPLGAHGGGPMIHRQARLAFQMRNEIGRFGQLFPHLRQE